MGFDHIIRESNERNSLQLSAVASSGYQSHAAHSQSSSPIEHAGSGVGAGVGGVDSGHGTCGSTMSSTTSQHSRGDSPSLPRTPLAFKNPMYHYPDRNRPKQAVERVSPTASSISSNNSIDDIIIVTPPSICKLPLSRFFYPCLMCKRNI